MRDRKRQAPIAQPTAERTADQSTQSASGLSAERPGVDAEGTDQDTREDVVARARPEGSSPTPRNYDE